MLLSCTELSSMHRQLLRLACTVGRATETVAAMGFVCAITWQDIDRLALLTSHLVADIAVSQAPRLTKSKIGIHKFNGILLHICAETCFRSH